ncbi:MAG TPA: glycosyltransferase family 2 protein [Candidatus Moranbacteria bacterium]|nr:glycosyltransferase family 2 protein [Candidatus Moranbacteria bacterium]
MLSIIIVNYQSQNELNNCLESLEKFLLPSKNNFEVIIVNNDKADIQLSPKLSFVVTMIDNKRNEGFGAACNLGARKAKGNFLFFLNPDTELTDNSLWKMLKESSVMPYLGIVGPKIIEAKRNRPQPWTSGKKTSLLNILFRNTFNKSWNKKEPIEVDWVAGTALLIRKGLFEKLGGFDEKFWMYFEDQDLCLRTRNSNLKVLFYPHCTILHHNGKSWSNTRNQKTAYYQSQKYFFQKHHGKISQYLLELAHKIAL